MNGLTLSRRSTLPNEPPHPLEYASPTVPWQPFRLRSQHVGFVTGTFAVVVAFFVPDTVGSGVIRVNPFAALACFAIMIGAIVYRWMRLFDERDELPWGSALVGTCSTIAILALPFQFWMVARVNHVPYSWWSRVKLFSPTLLRPDLYWPCAIVSVALVLAAIGRGITPHSNGPAGRNGP